MWICVSEERIRASDNLKYLGFTLDARINFDKLFEKQAAWVEVVVLLLCLLLSNMGELNFNLNLKLDNCIRTF